MDKEKIVISALIDNELVENISNYKSLCQTPACEALMAAYSKFEEDAMDEIWVGESDMDPSIVAVLERERSDEDICLVATVYDENALQRYLA